MTTTVSRVQTLHGAPPHLTGPPVNCTTPRHDGQTEPTPARPQSKLCWPCERDLGRDLRRLPALDYHLGIVALIQASPGNGTPRLPFDEDALEWQSWFRRSVTRTTITIALARKWRLPADHPWAMCAWLEPQVTWMALHTHDWAPMVAGMFHRIRVRGEQLAAPLTVKHVFLPGACLDCGNGRMQAVIYADRAAGRWSYWVCPVCRTATQIEFWWDYPKRLAAMKAVAG